MFWIQIMTDVPSVLICVQTIYKGQLQPKWQQVAASTERNKGKIISDSKLWHTAWCPWAYHFIFISKFWFNQRNDCQLRCFNSLPASGYFCRLLKPLQTVWIQIRTDRMSVLIWTQTVWHSDSVPKRIFFYKSQFWKVGRRQKKWKITQNAKSLASNKRNWKKDSFSAKDKAFYPLKRLQKKNASNNVVCFIRLLHIITNIITDVRVEANNVDL